ncbi:MAG: ferredoxin [Armatimonadota bacterium]|jgi:ferredoxin
MKVPWVDRDECTACGQCVEIAPNTFDLDEEDIAVVKDPKGDPEDTIQEAIEDCPAECIHWKEEE